jgi:hypothetical protein
VWNTFAHLDPDPDPEELMRIHADPDPQHCMRIIKNTIIFLPELALHKTISSNFNVTLYVESSSGILYFVFMLFIAAVYSDTDPDWTRIQHLLGLSM